MKQELELFRRDTLAAMDHARRLVSTVPPDAVSQRPGPGEWSIGECLDHLMATAKAYQPMVDDAIANGSPLRAESYKPGWIARKFIQSLEPPVKRKFRASAPFVPEKQRPAQEVLSDFVAAHQRLVDALPELDPLDLGKIRIVSPFASWMKYPLGLVFLIIPAHCRRHLWQADNVAARVLTR